MAVNIDEILEAIDELGPYQKRIFFLLFLPILFVGAANLSYVFIAATPKYRCFIENCDNKNSTYDEPFLKYTIPYNKKLHDFDTCSQYKRINESDTCTPYDFGTTAVNCTDGTVFDTSIYQTTIVSEFDLTCENGWQANMVQTVYFAGILVGCLLFGVLADLIGRRKTILFCIGLMSISGTATTFVPNVTVFNLVRFLYAMASAGLFQTAFVLGVEFVGPNRRVMFGILGQYFFAVGEVMLGLMAWYIRHWRMLQLVLAAPMVAFGFYYWIVPESVRWLQSKGRHSRVVQLLEEIAKTNKKSIPLHLLRHQAPDGDELDTSDDFAVLVTRHHKVSMLHVIKSCTMFSRLLVMAYTWIVTTLVYYGLTYSSVDLGMSSPYSNFILSALVEIPGYTIAWLGMNYVGRKITLILCLITSGAACAASGYLGAYGGLMIGAFLLGKASITGAFAVIYIFTAEMFPTTVRNTVIGSCSMFARIGGMAAPFETYLKKYYLPLPMLVFGGLSLVSSIITLILPETINTRLPDSIMDACNLGKRNVSAMLATVDTNEERESLIENEVGTEDRNEE